LKNGPVKTVPHFQGKKKVVHLGEVWVCGGEGSEPSTLKVTAARLWRGHQGRRRARQQRRWKRCLQLQRWWRSAKLRKRLVAKQRILRWLPSCTGDGIWDGMEILGMFLRADFGTDFL